MVQLFLVMAGIDGVGAYEAQSVVSGRERERERERESSLVWCDRISTQNLL